jgi:VWFA-related protein
MRALVFVALGMWVGLSDPSVPAIRLDAVVTTSTGAPILDLRPGDFELRENGVVRPIGAVELRAAPPAADADATPITSAEEEQRAARAPGTRVFAFVLDEYHVTPGPASERVRTSLTRFVETSLRPGDLAVAIKPLEAVSAIRFTRDRASLRTAITTFDGRKGDYAPRSQFEQQYIGHAPAAIEAARTQIVSAALREVSLRLGGLGADRGVIVLVSEGFARAPAARQLRVPDLQGLVRAASRFHLALYPYNPADRDPQAPLDASQGTLQWLATETGGQAVLDGAAFDGGLRRMASDLDAYYAVTYQPAQADGRFHALELVARRKNAQIRTRPGYWASLGSEFRALLAPPAAAVSRRALRRSTAVNVWAGVTLAPDGRTRLTVTWEPRGTQHASTMTVKAATSEGRALFEGKLAPVGAGGGVVPILATFDAPPGRVELDMDVLSISGATIDSDIRDIDVPDLAAQGKGPFILTPEIVRGRTAPEFRALSADPLAAPTPSRMFTRGDRLLIRVPVWNSTGAAVQVTAMVTNAIGGVMRDVELKDGPADSGARFELPLAWLAPGEYQIVLGAKTATGEDKESVRFSVR